MVAITNDCASALMTLSRRFAETANNVGRASTSNFEVQTTIECQSSTLPTTSSENLSSPATDGKSGVDLDKEMVRLHTTETYYVANLKVVATKDELQGTVLDILA